VLFLDSPKAMKQSQELKKVLEKYRIYPSKRLGQNFLIDKGAVRRIIETANLGAENTVLEIGPGLGVLTIELAKRVKKVIAIEKDPNLARILNNELRIKNIKNVEIIQGDILKLDPKPYTLKPYKIVANLPFYLTAPAIRKFLESKIQPQQMVLIVQKEVAQRICAKPPDMNLLAVSVQFYAKPEIISFVSRKSFWPQPKVDSAIIKIVSRQFRVPVSRQFRERFFRIVKAGFSQPRKQLINNLSKGLKLERNEVENWLLKNNIQATQRAETLSIEDWISLTKSCKIK